MKLDFRKLKCAVGLLASAVFASNLSAQVSSELSFERAIELGYTSVSWLPDGTDGWTFMDLPTEQIKPMPEN